MIKLIKIKNKKLETKIIYSIFIFAIIIRLFALLFLPNLYFQDSETYIQSGIHLFNKGYILEEITDIKKLNILDQLIFVDISNIDS